MQDGADASVSGGGVEEEYLDFVRGVEDLSQFRLSEGLCLSRPGSRRLEASDQAAALAGLGELAVRNVELLPIVMAIVGSTTFGNGDRTEHEAGLFRTARACLGRQRFAIREASDQHPSSSDDGLTFGSLWRPWTRAEKLVVLEALRALCEGWQGPGWAAFRMAEAEGVLLQVPGAQPELVVRQVAGREPGR